MTEKGLPKLDWRVVVNRATPPGVRGWGRVRAAQLLEMTRAMEVAAWGQTFNALLICYLLAGHDGEHCNDAGWFTLEVSA